jgi:hypothetical protein
MTKQKLCYLRTKELNEEVDSQALKMFLKMLFRALFSRGFLFFSLSL